MNSLIRILAQPFCADGAVQEGGRRLARVLGNADPRSSADPSLRVDAALDSKLSPEGQMWADRIESLRDSLLHSGEEVELLRLGGSKKTSSVRGSEASGLTCSVGEMCESSSGPRWGRRLFNAVSVTSPVTCLELGTCLGISAAYQAAALRENGAGRLVTLEGSPDLAAVARRNLHQLGFDNVEVRVGPFVETLQSALDELSSVEFAFIDGHHDEEATISYFDTILPYTVSGTVLIFDDVRWSRGMRRAWYRIASHPDIRTIRDLRRWGVCLVSP